MLGLVMPAASGSGLIPLVTAGNYRAGTLLFIFIIRLATTLLCFCSGVVPSGILR